MFVPKRSLDEMNVLLVDDKQMDRELVKEALYSSGRSFDITEVSNARDGLSCLNSTDFDVVLLDYQMPYMTGLELLSKIKNTDASRRATVVVISNNRDEDLMISCINEGAQDFILKDEISSSHLVRCIKQSQRRLALENKLTESYHQVKTLAEKDQLTGLSNRHHFEQVLSSLLANPRGINGYVVVMLLDLDGFKMINDSLGHCAGDEILKEFADRIRHRFRESRLFARLGGDEFAFVFTGISEAFGAFKIADRILGSFEQPFEVDDHHIPCSASIGITVTSATDGNVHDLIKRADIAMYHAKGSGKNKACLYEEYLENEFLKSYNIENELRQAIEGHEFELHYQPIYECESRRLQGVEALVRWPSGKTSKNPEEFIQVAEKTRLIEPLGRWIVTQAFRQFSQLRSQIDAPDMHISINLSPLQIHDLNLPTYIKEQAELNQVPLSNVIVEVTETALLENNDGTLETLKAIKEMNCHIALDDFGTGFSSISHLPELSH